jgi:hypothetical protein
VTLPPLLNRRRRFLSEAFFKKEEPMKTALAVVMTLSLMVAMGCQSSRGGGMSGGEGFRIGTPTFDTKITQGETKNVTISLNRGEFFKRDVTLDIKASQGISVEPTRAVVRGNEKPEVSLRITAPRDTSLGEYKIFVKGTPETGEPTSTEITVKVVAP